MHREIRHSGHMVSDILSRFYRRHPTDVWGSGFELQVPISEVYAVARSLVQSVHCGRLWVNKQGCGIVPWTECLLGSDLDICLGGKAYWYRDFSSRYGSICIFRFSINKLCQHHLLKKLSFMYWIVLTSFSEMSLDVWTYIWVFASVPSIHL